MLEAYRRGLVEGWANPSSLHGAGRKARALLEEAREQVAALAGVLAGNVTFTGSGTEALNQALFTATRAAGAHVVASAVEHPAVLEKLAGLEAAGEATASLAPVDGAARVDVPALEELIGPSTTLVAVLAAQNEVGTVQPLDEVGAACERASVPLLVDASQAVGRLARDWAALPWDYLVISAHKLRAPRGAAALIHRGHAPEPQALLLGGAQERGRRGGTEAVAGIMALGRACELARLGELFDPPALLARRERLEALLQERVPGVTILARDAERLPQTTAFLVAGRDSEALLARLDLEGVGASSGSACASGALKPSHVLAAMGIPADQAAGRLRFSFGPETADADLERAVEILAGL